MILHKLVLENFRQFRGRQEIRFASPKKHGGPNITVLFGENGRGKTGIFRALVFCLYGERLLSQDDETPKGELCLINLHELKNGKAGNAFPVRASVEVEFSHAGQKYAVRRTLTGILHGQTVQEEVGEVSLSVQDPDGNTSTFSDPKDVHTRITEVLDSRVKEYFLFDGEKIERLTRANAEQRREVSKGIRNLLNIDDLELAIRAAGKFCRQLDSEIQGRSTGEHARVIQQINDLEDRQGGIRKRTLELDEESHKARTELQKVDKELQQYKEISDLLLERKSLESKRQDLTEQSGSALGQMKARSARTAVGIIEASLREVFNAIDAKKKRGELPPEIRGELIEKLLAEGTCICGRKIDKGSDALKHILHWKERSSDPGVSDVALELWRHLSTITSRIDDERPVTEAILQRYAEIKHEFRAIESRLDQIKELIGSSERKDAAKLESHRNRIQQDLVTFEAEKQNLTEELARITSELEMLRAKRTQLENDLSIRNELVRRSQLASKVRDALASVFDSFRKDVTERIGKEATKLLFLLLDKDGQKNLREIVVKDDYSLQIIDRWNGQFLANISAGQRQIMSIAFIAALAKAAAGGNSMEVPLFMDTPFGRLSFEHRKNLIANIPDLAAQWILLATETELTRDEGRLLVSGKRIGRFYRLKPANDGTTTIEERSLDDVLPILSSGRPTT